MWNKSVCPALNWSICHQDHNILLHKQCYSQNIIHTLYIFLYIYQVLTKFVEINQSACLLVVESAMKTITYCCINSAIPKILSGTVFIKIIFLRGCVTNFVINIFLYLWNHKKIQFYFNAIEFYCSRSHLNYLIGYMLKQYRFLVICKKVFLYCVFIYTEC